jgi:ubiquinone/menaquinone biosynthesis C-methylase UbiE
VWSAPSGIRDGESAEDGTMDLSLMYRERFGATKLETRRRVWSVLCRSFFDDLVGKNSDVLDLGCGYGEFINNIRARRKIAVDLNPDARSHLDKDITFILSPGTDLSPVPDANVDVVFASNFLEHLPSKAECDVVFAEIKRVLRPGGRFIAMGPNIRYAYKNYWDFYDHQLPLSDRSLEEGLKTSGFGVVRNIPRFLPFTMQSSLPTADALIKIYLAMPLFWRLFGRQFLIIGQKR